MSTLKYVGESITDVLAVNKVTGAAVFADDVSLPGMLYGVLVRSEHAHAKVKSIDISEALKVPGVETVVTYKDFPDLKFGTYVRDQNAFTDHPRYIGDPIAGVAANTLAVAEEAAKKVKIEYEVLDYILDPVEAMKPESFLIHPDSHTYDRVTYPGFYNIMPGTNCPNQFRLRKGDVEKGFAESDYIVENEIHVPPIYHGAIEPHACVCKFDPSGKLTVYACTQGPHLMRESLTFSLGIPMNMIRVIKTGIGGGFGGKIAANIEIRASAIAMKCNNRPVKLVLPREEEWETLFVRQAVVGYYKTGVKKDGKIIARKIALYWDAGAYADYEVSVARAAGMMAAGPYDIENIWTDSHAVYTNKLVATAYRGFGCSETSFCFEQDMDSIAEKIGMDPIEFRLKNVLKKDDLNMTGQKLKSFALEDCINAVAAKADPNLKSSEDGRYLRGKGIGCIHKFTIHTTCACDIAKLNEDGTVILLTSAAEIGQGSSTIQTQILAESLGIPIEKITISAYDTDASGWSFQTAGSQKTFINGNATKMAGLDLKKKLIHYGSKSLNVPEADLDTKDGFIISKKDSSVSVPFAALAMGVYDAEGGLYGGPPHGDGSYVFGEGTGLDPETGQGKRPSAFWMTAAMIAEVEIDTYTGNIRVLRLISGNDVGKMINPRNVEGQVYGGGIQGYGSTIFEEVLFDDKGKVLNANMHDYKMPTIGDIPDEFIFIPIETQPHPDGPYGAKGVGEASMACPAAAIANAVADAIGERIYSLPLTPEKVLDAIKRGGK